MKSSPFFPIFYGSSFYQPTNFDYLCTMKEKTFNVGYKLIII